MILIDVKYYILFFIKWQTEDSWFPGYVWKVCVCAKCGRHIGW